MIKIKEKADLQQEVKNVLEPEKPEQADSNTRPAYESLPYYQRCLQQAREALKMFALAAQVAQEEPHEEEHHEEEQNDEKRQNPGDGNENSNNVNGKKSSPVLPTIWIDKKGKGHSRGLGEGESARITEAGRTYEFFGKNSDQSPKSPTLADGLTMGEGGQIELNIDGK